MSGRLTECRCGRPIAPDWPECGECGIFDDERIATGEYQFRREELRHAAILNRGWDGPVVDPKDPLLSRVASAVEKQADRDALLIERALRRKMLGEAAVAALRTLSEDDS